MASDPVDPMRESAKLDRIVVVERATSPAEPREPCCDMHNKHCEPPSELCCHECTEAAHPHHPRGAVCVLATSPAEPEGERSGGLGSVCRRQDTGEIHEIVAALAELDIDLHGFGVKTDGLARYGHLLTSADSLAWSYAGRRTPGCTPTHRNEANCRRFALAWRDTVLDRIDRAQPTLWEAS